MRSAGGLADGPAIVVGGASGIGAAVVAAHRAQGTPVLVWDVAGDRDVDCDVSDERAIADALRVTISEIGVPRWTTITAGIGHPSLLIDAEVADWDRVMTTNTRGPWLVMREVGRALAAAGKSGSIVATSSVSAHLVDRGLGVYCASKAALSMIIRVAAFEMAPMGIRVNGVGPGVTVTPLLMGAPIGEGWLAAVQDRTPLGRLGQPEDIAEVVLSLHGLEWVTGQILDCDGGLSLFSPVNAFGAAIGEEAV